MIVMAIDVPKRLESEVLDLIQEAKKIHVPKGPGRTVSVPVTFVYKTDMQGKCTEHQGEENG